MIELRPIDPEPVSHTETAPLPDPRLEAGFSSQKAADAGVPAGPELVPTDTDAANNRQPETAEPEVAPDGYATEEPARPQPEPAAAGKDHAERAIAEQEMARPAGSMLTGAAVEAIHIVEGPDEVTEESVTQVATNENTDRRSPVEDLETEERLPAAEEAASTIDESLPPVEDEATSTTSVDAPKNEFGPHAPEAVVEKIVNEDGAGPGEGDKPGDDQEPEQGGEVSEGSTQPPEDADDRRPAEPGSGDAGSGGGDEDGGLPPGSDDRGGESNDEAAFRALQEHFSPSERGEVPPEALPRHMTLYDLSGVDHARFMVNFAPDVHINADLTVVDRQLIEHNLELAGLPDGWMRMVFTEPEQHGIEELPQPWRAPETRHTDIDFDPVSEFGVKNMMLIDYPRMLMPTGSGVLETTRGMVVAINKPGFVQVVSHRAEVYRDRTQGRDRHAHDRATADVLDELTRSALYQATRRSGSEQDPNPFPLVDLPRTLVNRARLVLQDRLGRRLIEYYPHHDNPDSAS
jgi:hypothetical protein